MASKPYVVQPYQGSHDAIRMAALVRQNPASATHVVDLPYRLSSWAFDDPANCALWSDHDGELYAWAVLQSPFWALDYALHPAAASLLEDALLPWADQRARAIQATRFGRPAWFVNQFNWQSPTALTQAGFESQANRGDESWSKVLFGRALTQLIPPPPLPDGFQMRPLAGASEVDAYVALHRAVFQSENMTAGWRGAVLHHPDYRPELDLVVVDPAGQLAAFCIGWLTPQVPHQPPRGQIEPFGVRADLRRTGIGRSLLCECFQRMCAAGAEQVAVETDNYRDAAFQFYTALGFVAEHEIVVYRKDYPATNNSGS